MSLLWDENIIAEVAVIADPRLFPVFCDEMFQKRYFVMQRSRVFKDQGFPEDGFTELAFVDAPDRKSVV